MRQLILQIQQCGSISLGTVVPTLCLEKLSSLSFVRAGVDIPAGSIFLRVTGLLDSLVILRELQR